MDTLKFILASENMPFAVALAVMGMIALFEVLGMLIGAGLSDVLDLLLPDLDDAVASRSCPDARS